MKPRPCYVRWHDAALAEDDLAPADMGLCELLELGWLVREDGESVSIAMERQRGVTTHRYSLTIPRANILELRKFKVPKRRRK